MGIPLTETTLRQARAGGGIPVYCTARRGDDSINKRSGEDATIVRILAGSQFKQDLRLTARHDG
jgi:hypothetical protein